MTGRENAEQRGRRLLAEGRLLVHAVGPSHVDATCRGSGEVHHVTYRRGGWHCTCPALGRCAHLVALMLVTAPLQPAPAPWSQVEERSA